LKIVYNGKENVFENIVNRLLIYSFIKIGDMGEGGEYEGDSKARQSVMRGIEV
jgi:hypothetical protein